MGLMNAPNQQQDIARVLSETKTIAVVGLSSRPTRAGHYVPAYLQNAGYRIIPVNPYLDEALGQFEKGVKLAKFLRQELDKAEKKIELLLKDADGEIREEPFVPDETSDEDASDNPDSGDDELPF